MFTHIILAKSQAPMLEAQHLRDLPNAIVSLSSVLVKDHPHQ